MSTNRTALIRLAAKLPKGSNARRDILSGLRESSESHGILQTEMLHISGRAALDGRAEAGVLRYVYFNSPIRGLAVGFVTSKAKTSWYMGGFYGYDALKNPVDSGSFTGPGHFERAKADAWVAVNAGLRDLEEEGQKWMSLLSSQEADMKRAFSDLSREEIAKSLRVPVP